MQAIEFESQLSHGTLAVPKSLLLAEGRRGRVLLLLDGLEAKPVEHSDAIADLFADPIVCADFQPLTREQSALS